MKCSKCGAELLSDTDKFCSNCGQKVEPINESIPNGEKTDEPSITLNATINQQEQTNTSTQNIDNSHNNKVGKVGGIWNRLSSYGKYTTIALVLFALLCIIAFLFGKVFAGVIAIIQFVLILAALLIKKQIIKAKKSINILAIVIAVALFIPYGALLFKSDLDKISPVSGNTAQPTEINTMQTTKQTENNTVQTKNEIENNLPQTTESITSPQEISSPKYEVKIEVNCVENLIFSKYNVKIYIDGNLQGILLHGGTDTYTAFLENGVHNIKFASENDETVVGEVQINISQNDVFKYEIYCTSLEINVSDLLSETETEESTTVQTTETNKINSEYEMAFISKNSEYDLYYMFDFDNKKVIYFGTNGSGVMEGTYSGDFSSGVTMMWEAGGDTWTEKFIYKENSNIATWVDHLGYEYPYYTVCDVNIAQSVLDKIS